MVKIRKTDKRQKNKGAEELERMWKSVDLSRFWIEVTRASTKKIDAYDYARAKSKEGAASHVLV